MTKTMTRANGAYLIAAERKRQVEQEGWSLDHDRRHGAHRLLRAAVAYEVGERNYWPFSDGWKPKGALRNLVRAGALYLAAQEASGSEVFVSGRVGAERCAEKIDTLIAEVLEVI